ncbi:MAG: nicotinate phosphoribosyltransferase [Acidobacteria bacterium]|nr:nicotinate phosphoribosyltransferase [Acidobacteriota bacterium]
MNFMSSLALSTDLYELTMMAGYYTAGLDAPATFELYVRELPPNRSFLVAAGLEQALAYLEGLRFTDEHIAHLRGLPALRGVRREFFDEYLPRFRFSGDVWAVEEGIPVFPPAPLLRVTAPLPEAQLVETALLALVAFQTSVASRAARIVEAAAGREVVEFGARRAHGIEAGVLAARAAVIGGCDSTSNVEAGRRYGIPVSGTMAHSWVTAVPTEIAAFRQFAGIYGDRTVFLLDTYDTIAAARWVAASGLAPAAVRLDSGDVIALSREVRAILDATGLRATKIFASGDLDEWRIAAIVQAGAPVDGFGVGAALSTSSDAPSLGAIYKLVEIERGGVPVPVMKRSPGKQTYPGRKQVWRLFEHDTAVEDILEVEDAQGEPVRVEPPYAVRPLLVPVMRGGRRERPPVPLADLRARQLAATARLPAAVRRLAEPARYRVRLGSALQSAVERFG